MPSCELAVMVCSRIVISLLEIITMPSLAVEVLILMGRVAGGESEACKPGRSAKSLFGELISGAIWLNRQHRTELSPRKMTLA